MELRPFKIERYFGEHEFTARGLLSASDCESWTLPELLAMADDDETSLLWERLRLGYTESQGHPVLRHEIARQYNGIKDEDVLVAAPEEAIFIAMHSLLKPGEEVIVTWPAYQSLVEVAAYRGCRVIRCPLIFRDGSWSMDVNGLARLVTPRTRLLVVNFPHNPTGFQPTPEAWRDIVDFARDHELYLFSDEMYRLLEQNPADRLDACCDVYERGVTLSGLSKSYGLPGLRIGWLATCDAGVLARCQGLKDYTTICSSAPSEVLAIIALRARETIVGRNREILAENLRLADAFFAERVETFDWAGPAAGPVAFPLLTNGQPVSEWCAEILATRGIMIAPGDMFDHDGNHFRVGLGRMSFEETLHQLQT